jgi:uncharacterized protein YchJ
MKLIPLVERVFGKGPLSRTLKLLLDRDARDATKQFMEQAQKEGVNIANRQERKGWIRRHRSEMREVIFHNEPKSSEKVGRNSPCLCGSGMKFKKCCGAIAAK